MTLFRLNTLNGADKAPTLDLLSLNTKVPNPKPETKVIALSINHKNTGNSMNQSKELIKYVCSRHEARETCARESQLVQVLHMSG